MSSGVQLATDGIVARNLRSQGVSMATGGVISYYIGEPSKLSKFIEHFILNVNTNVEFRLER